MKHTMEQHAGKILNELKKTYPQAGCSLTFRTPLELLVATILSAQCTDVRVNKVTPTLFQQFRTAQDYADAPIELLEEFIRMTGFFRNKAKNIQSACREIIARFDGDVPDTMEALVSLPGVGRKTANVVLSNGFGRTEGITVDTHVFRLSHRMGLALGKTPEKVELELMQLFPKSDWTFLSHALILHGRQVCTARTAQCEKCSVRKVCPGRGTIKKLR